ncbi:MarR family winged helix-turn-helix transcriptional regulator [Chitinophaga arvensicola]|uniref:DNA-binding transcriptional regulator, MarR family n=1 Tax=Chitinophaga arvensicola TaxID=29529 RepID=A0A1I0R6S4_9BACT|nr:MarR family winged helix-turn-helix transcriptional regulator [Chitinophaga arvensicola]SEW36278.1 DNA-binding transcriptional regulator, MarR family [Chitinophaga arvensicola]
MDYDLIKSIIDHAAEYEQTAVSGNNRDIASFAEWLYKKTQQLPGKPVGTGAEPQVSLDTAIGRKVIRLNRYVKLYSKNALQGTPLGSSEEFSYLATLLSGKQIKKSDLIQMNIHEKPTGMEIIKRLIKSELVMQTNHPSDQRSQLLAITDKGKAVLYQVFRKMENVSKLVGGQLTADEKETLHELLKKLDAFHLDIFLNQKQDVYKSLRGE